MAKRYRPVDRDQPFLLPPDMREWLPAGHQVYLVITAVEDHLDTSAFHAGRRTGGAGAAGYDPDMMVALLFWAYAQGLVSSRRIEAACWSDVAFRVVCAGDVPDHVTICRFRSADPGAVESLFGEVLVLCARLGMGKLGTIALDGMKIAADASKPANRTEETLRKLAAGLVAEHAANDAAEDELFGPGRRGDEVPAPLADPRSRAGRIAAALAELEAERTAAEAAAAQQAAEYLAGQQAGSPGAGAPPLAAAAAAAAARLGAARAARAAQIAELEDRLAGPLRPGRRRSRPGTGVEDYCLVQAAREALARAAARAAGAERKAAGKKKPVRNITDPDSRLMPVRGGGFLQGYNAQNVTSEDGLIIATRLTNDTTDTRWYEPMISDACDAAALITANQPPSGDGADRASAEDAAAHHGAAGDSEGDGDGEGEGEGEGEGQREGSGIGLVLADAGYLSLDNLKASGPGRLIATGKRRTLEKAARQAAGEQEPGQEDPGDALITAMTARLATEEGITAYRKRGHIAETPHGNIKHNKRFRQLSVRGKPKAAAEWTLAATVHNLFKAITSGHLTTEALAALPR